jgi:hypothetical protein
VGLGNALGHQALVGRIHRKGDQVIDEGGLALHPGAQRLGGHVAAVDDGVAGQHPQGRGVARHLDVGVLEDVLVAVEALGLLIEAGEGGYLRLDLPGSPRPGRPGRSCPPPAACGTPASTVPLTWLPFAQGTVGLGDHVPGGGDLQPGGPDDVGHVGPDEPD